MCRRRFGAARQTLAARVRAMRRAPERARAGFGSGSRRKARAIARAGPPGHRHVAVVDRIEAALRMEPIETVGACRARRRRRGDGAFAAPLTAVGLWPMRDLFRAEGDIRRAAAAVALVLPQTTPKHAIRAVGGTVRRVVQSGLPRWLQFGSAVLDVRAHLGRPSPAQREHEPDIGVELARAQGDHGAFGVQRGVLRRDHVEIGRRAIAIK